MPATAKPSVASSRSSQGAQRPLTGLRRLAGFAGLRRFAGFAGLRRFAGFAGLRRLAGFAGPYRRALGLGLVLAVVEVVVNLAQPWPLKIIVDDVLGGRHAAETVSRGIDDVLLAVAVGLGLALAGCGALVDYWSTRLLTSSGLQIANDLRRETFAHLQRQSLRFHGENRVGDLSSRVTADVDRSQDMLVQALATLVPNGLLVVGMFVVMLTIDVKFTLLAMSATPMLVVAVHRSTTDLKAAARRARKADGDLVAAATEHLGAIGLVQAFTMEGRQADRFGALSRTSLRAGLESARLQARFSPLVDASSALSVAAVLWFGVHEVGSGRISLGSLLVFLTYLGSLYKPLKQLSKLSTIWSKGAAATERVFSVLGTEPAVVDLPGAVSAPRLRGALSFRDVTFSYGREPVLRGVSFDIEPGQTVALVGPTGAGKSTIASLVPRLADVTSGMVALDGTDVRALRLHTVRSQVSMVLQDCLLLRGTLRENIAFGLAGASDAAIERAASLALVDEFAARLPRGLDTMIGERGADLSGGQRQRIAIARAILRNAPILILDEPTSALDAESETLLLAALDNLPRGRTTLVIAHRLSTIRRADRILVIEGGQITESGTHDELVRLDGRYRRLSSLQGLAAPGNGSPSTLPGTRDPLAVGGGRTARGASCLPTLPSPPAPPATCAPMLQPIKEK